MPDTSRGRKHACCKRRSIRLLYVFLLLFLFFAQRSLLLCDQNEVRYVKIGFVSLSFSFSSPFFSQDRRNCHLSSKMYSKMKLIIFSFEARESLMPTVQNRISEKLRPAQASVKTPLRDLIMGSSCPAVAEPEELLGLPFRLRGP